MGLETALVFDLIGRTLHWHEPPNRTSGSIPDSQDLWDVLWESRDRLGGVAHTHPWNGQALPSKTDITTFAAIEKGLGKRFIWPVVTFDSIAYVVRNPLYASDAEFGWTAASVNPNIFTIEGIDELRERSGFAAQKETEHG